MSVANKFNGLYWAAILVAILIPDAAYADHFHQVTVRSVATYESSGSPESDVANSATFDQSGPWIPVEGDTLDLGYRNSYFLVKVTLFAPPDISGEWVLSLASSDLDSVEFLIPRSEENDRWERSGNFASHAEKSIDSAEPAFPLSLEPGRETTAYLRIRSDSYKKFPIELYTIDEFRTRQTLHNSYHAVFLLIGFLLLSYNLYAFARTRELFRLWVALFIVLNTIALWSGYGNAHKIGWPTYPVWRNQIHYFLCSLALIFAAQITRSFVQGRLRERTANFAGIAATVASPVLLANISAHGRVSLYTLIFLVAALSLIGASMNARKPFVFNRIVWAWILFFVFGSLSLLFVHGYLPFHRFILYGGAFALPLTGLLLTPRISAPTDSQESGDVRPAAKYSKSKLQGVNVAEVVERLQTLMREDKVYTDSELRMDDLANQLSIAPYHLSEILNNVLDINYATYINRHRVEEVKRLLVEKPELNVLTVALNAGFDTKSNFNRVFKDMVGSSPRDFRRTNAE